VLVAASLTAPTAASAAAPVPIDIAPGVAYGINDRGQVVGGGVFGESGWVWKQGVGMTILDSAPPFGRPGLPRAINENGMVVGAIPVGDNANRGFVWTAASGSIVLGNLGGDDYMSTQALDVNEHGQIVGMRGNGRYTFREDQAVMWTPEGWMAKLARNNSFATAINDRGEAAGTVDELCSYLCNGHAVMWTADGEMIALDDQRAGDFSQATDINNRGEVVGWHGSQPFLWTRAHGMVDLGSLPGGGAGVAYGINDSGQVVGSSGGRPFLWTPEGGMVELGTLPGDDFSAAYAINNRGQIAGTTAHRAVMWFGDTTAPTAKIRILHGEKLADVRSRGLRLQLTVTEPGSTEITLTRGKKTLGAKTVNATAAGTSAVTFKLARKVRVALRKPRTATFTLRTAVRDPAGNSTVASTKVTVKR
jgi:probable HAF family extracellular repeat protein